MKNKLLILMAVVLGLLPAMLNAQVLPFPREVDPVFRGLTADDTDIVFKFVYRGTATNNSGLVAVAANGDLTFTQGVLGAEVASTEFECPVSGALGGVIDVSDAACNTVGEVCDIVNDSTSWYCIAVDAMRTDVVDARILTAAATRATSLDGYSVFWDTSTAFDATVALVPALYRSARGYIGAPLPGGGRTRGTINFDPFADQRTLVFQGSATSTYGTGTSTIRFYSVNISQPPNDRSTWTEQVEEIFFTPGGATTVAQTFDFRDLSLPGRLGDKVIARLDNTTAMSAVNFRVSGITQRAAAR